MTFTRGRPTTYKGITMRSRLEASFAAWLDVHHFLWKYEPLCFADETGQYLPDFYVTRGADRAFCEVKPPRADTGAALHRMHVIRSSTPTAILNVVVPTGVYPHQGWAVAGKCREVGGCSFCDPTAPPFRDLRTIAGAERRVGSERITSW